MFKRTLAVLISALIALSACSVTVFSVSAEAQAYADKAHQAYVDEETSDEATTDEAVIVISDIPFADKDGIKGTVIGYIGDSDGNDKVNVRDATNIQKLVAKLQFFTSQQLILCDVDFSGNLNIRDATTIQKYIASFEVDAKIMHLMYEKGEHNHSYSEAVVAPMCEAVGYTSYSCICGDEYKENEVPATGHNYKEVVTKPTCTEQGYTTHICSGCRHSYKDTYTDATRHTYTTKKVAPTCTKEGYTILSCSKCDYSYTDYKTPVNGEHSYNSKGICKECGADKIEVSVDTLKAFIKENGEYDKDNKLYIYTIQAVQSGDYAALSYSVSEDLVIITCFYEYEGYIDIISVGINSDKECGFYMYCDYAYESAGVINKSKFNKDSKKVEEIEYYIVADITEQQALANTIAYIKGALYTYEYNNSNLPVSLQDLGFNSFK